MIALCIQVFAQYPVGHRTITFQDPARSNRNIQTEIYYPATVAGDDVAFASGQFPIIAFGHGFVMAVSSYDNIWTTLCPLGYIVALLTTEGSTSPSHSDFGADLAFLINKLQSEGSNSSSPLYQKVGTTSAVMGHSMGGGSSFLACENNTTPTVMVTFAAAVTTPSSVTAAANVTIPCLVISGSEDCTAPPADHQVPMYNALASDCKVYFSIINGGHCYFANYNFNCTLGESFCLPVVPIDRTVQQTIAMNFVIPYFDYFLKGNVASWTSFVDSLNNSSNITFVKNCDINPANVDAESISINMSVFPNPASDMLNIAFSEPQDAIIELTDITGRKLITKEVNNQTVNIDISNLKQGVYLVKFIKNNKPINTRRFIKM